MFTTLFGEKDRRMANSYLILFQVYKTQNKLLKSEKMCFKAASIVKEGKEKILSLCGEYLLGTEKIQGSGDFAQAFAPSRRKKGRGVLHCKCWEAVICAVADLMKLK